MGNKGSSFMRVDWCWFVFVVAELHITCSQKRLKLKHFPAGLRGVNVQPRASLRPGQQADAKSSIVQSEPSTLHLAMEVEVEVEMEVEVEVEVKVEVPERRSGGWSGIYIYGASAGGSCGGSCSSSGGCGGCGSVRCDMMKRMKGIKKQINEQSVDRESYSANFINFIGISCIVQKRRRERVETKIKRKDSKLYEHVLKYENVLKLEGLDFCSEVIGLI
ncbi:hypothetical protein RhiirA4_444133 [Rhizophagus irregularis]|uniref:Uncharacterized protein n=1 Tax=Rhizophagus irregularis TaxID=588596 RepID=A0A2I1GHK3_9GLOM|nr:hypothetical protein RhiirA4_444133 [Rhizophagus irregularis]